MVLSLSLFSTVMPVISFLFVFILVYALLAKTKVLGENSSISVFLSLIIASFFIINTKIVDWVNASTSWIVVLIVVVFFIMLILAFIGKDSLAVLTTNKSVTWVIVALIIIVFVIASSYSFNWVINWDLVQTWFDKDWFGMLVLVIFAGIVAKVLTTVKK